MISAQLMAIDPARAVRVLLVDKSDPQRVFGRIARGVEDGRETAADNISGHLRGSGPDRDPGEGPRQVSRPGNACRPGLFHESGRLCQCRLFVGRTDLLPLFNEGDPVRPVRGHKLAPEPEQAAADLIVPLPQKAVQTVDPQINEQGIPGGQAHLEAALCPVDRIESRKARAELLQQVLRPGVTQILLQDRRQLRVAARLGKGDLEHARHPEKVQILIIDPALDRIRPGRPDPDDIGRDRDRSQKAHHRDPLVALLHIEEVHKLIGLDGFAQPLPDLGVIKTAPLGGKFRVLLHQRHEIGGKGVLPAAGPRSGDHIQRDLPDPQRDLRIPVHIPDHVLQRRQIGVLPPGHSPPVFLLPKLLCPCVISDQALFLLSSFYSIY